MSSKERSRAKSQKMEKKSVNVKPKEQKVEEKKVKLSQGQKDKLRKKKKKAREYLERILSSDTTGNPRKSSDELLSSTKKASKKNSSDTNLRTEERINGDESGLSKSNKPHSGNDFGSSKPEVPFVEVKTVKPKAGQAWVNLFK
ncbi:hypothetical protein HanRHA438_Chr15g0714291 [Helianthus annuus]|nr:hypothetical protein HanRHA438_Chr15g0714291 [Helianthus annuus]